MDDTSNWEFVALVAAVAIGLGGMLVFSLIAAVGSWRLFRNANRAAAEAARANLEVQELAEQVIATVRHVGGQDELAAVRTLAESLVEEQKHVQESMRRLAERRIERSEEEEQQYRDLESVMRRLEENLARIGGAVDDLDRHQL